MQNAQELGGQVSGMVDGLLPLITQWGLKVIGGLVVFIIGLMVAKSVRRGAQKVFDRTDMEPTLEKFLSSLLYYLILAVVAVASLGMIGVQTASVLAMLGAAGLAVGLALQGTLSNVAAGVMLLFFRPFKVGDFVDIGGTAGTVDSIGLFSTILNTPDNVHIVVPNSGIYGGTIKNFSFNPSAVTTWLWGSRTMMISRWPWIPSGRCWRPMSGS